MKTLYILAVVLGLSACTKDPYKPTWVADQCIRAELFKSCMAALPKGPEKIDNSNDWDEVVEACGTVAYHQSIRQRSIVKEECKAD